MDMSKTLKLMNKYGKCPQCNNEMVGNGQGKLIVEDDSFTRECKCGFKIIVDEDDNIIK